MDVGVGLVVAVGCIAIGHRGVVVFVGTVNAMAYVLRGASGTMLALGEPM